MKNFLKITVAVIAILTFVSCKKDKEDPTILIAEPIDHEEFHWGGELHVEAIFEDDRALQSYHIHIGNEAGDHAAEFGLEFAADISGTSYSFHEHFIIPDSVAHEYYLHFEATDAEGKTTSQKLLLHFVE